MGDAAKITTGSKYFDFALVAPALWNVSMDALSPLVPEAPEIPEVPTPEAPTEVGEEGIRRGEMQRQSRRRELGALYLTRGQERSPTLGGMKQTLG